MTDRNRATQYCKGGWCGFVETGCFELGRGPHSWEIFAFEDCCDGVQRVQFRHYPLGTSTEILDDNSEDGWHSVTDDNLEEYAEQTEVLPTHSPSQAPTPPTSAPTLAPSNPADTSQPSAAPSTSGPTAAPSTFGPTASPTWADPTKCGGSWMAIEPRRSSHPFRMFLTKDVPLQPLSLPAVLNWPMGDAAYNEESIVSISVPATANFNLARIAVTIKGLRHARVGAMRLTLQVRSKNVLSTIEIALHLPAATLHHRNSFL